MINAALQLVVSHPVQSVAIPGAKSPEQASMNAKAGDRLLSELEREQLIHYVKDDEPESVPSQNVAGVA